MFRVSVLLLAMASFSAAPPPAERQPPRLEAVAETKLLMEGINQANFQGLEQLLRQKPTAAETWKFVRGQALLIAENGNLLMLRPPSGEGRRVWLERSEDLRSAAVRLARAASDRDYDLSRGRLNSLAAACSRCHQSFGVPVRIVPFADKKPGATKPSIP